MDKLTSKKRRIQNTTVSCPVVYGSFALWMGKKADEYATHKWTLFVRGPNSENLSTFISKVSFTLHPSFAEPLREVYSAPFEVTEMGWGEFEANIRLHFKDEGEQPIDLIHMIKLYPPDSSALTPLVKTPVLSEHYDEIVFTDPSSSFHPCLMQYGSSSLSSKSVVEDHRSIFDEDKDLSLLSAAQYHVTREIEAVKASLLQLDAELHYVQTQVQAQAHSATSLISTAPSHNNTSEKEREKEKGGEREREKESNVGVKGSKSEGTTAKEREKGKEKEKEREKEKEGSAGIKSEGD